MAAHFFEKTCLTGLMNYLTGSQHKKIVKINWSTTGVSPTHYHNHKMITTPQTHFESTSDRKLSATNENWCNRCVITIMSIGSVSGPRVEISSGVDASCRR